MNTQPVTVLIIEDNPGDVRLIKEMLKEAKVRHYMLAASTLARGIDLCGQHDVDIILLDISLPDSRGLETVTSLREEISEVPIVVLTGHNNDELGLEAVAAGAQDYLFKGEINASMLLRCIRYTRERHRVILANQQLAALQERQRLARELHDSVTQTLFSANAMAESSLIQWEVQPDKSHDLIKKVHQLTKGALAEMRMLLLELRPEALLDLPLHTLILQLIESIQGRKDLHVKVDVEPIAELSPQQRLSLYRVAQEALNNTIKHAHSGYVEVKLKQAEDLVKLEIADDGVGFDVDYVNNYSMGLDIMRERAHKIDAELDIVSQTGQGTVVSLTLNISQENLKTA